MPYTIRKRDCRQSSGKKGKYVLSYTSKKGKKYNNCHTSRKKAQGQIAAIEGPKEGVNEEDFHEAGCGCGVSEGYSTLTHRATQFRNPYEDPGDEFEMDPDDPVGLVRAVVQAEIERQVRAEGRRRR